MSSTKSDDVKEKQFMSYEFVSAVKDLSFTSSDFVRAVKDFSL